MKQLVGALLMLMMLGGFTTQTAGPSSPASASDDSNGTNGAGGTAWASQSSATGALDGVGATCALPPTANTATDLLVLNNFGFALPAGSTVNGVSVTVTLKGTTTLFDNVVKLCTAAGTVVGANQSRTATGPNWSTSYNAVTYGSSSTTWGASLTAAQLNSSGFGFEIGAVVFGSASGTQTANVDGATMTVTYTPPPTGGHRIFPMAQVRSAGFQRDVNGPQTGALTDQVF